MSYKEEEQNWRIMFGAGILGAVLLSKLVSAEEGEAHFSGSDIYMR